MDFDRLLDQVYPDLVRYCRRHQADPARAEEVALDAFLRFLEVRPRGDAEVLRGWLYREATKRLLSESPDPDSGTRLRTTVRPTQDETTRPTPQALQEQEQAERTREVRRRLEALNEADRALLLLRDEGFSYRAVAELTGTPPAMVAPRLMEARRTFQADPPDPEALPVQFDMLDGTLGGHLPDAALLPLAEGEAPQGSEEEVDAHMAACPVCRQRVAALEALAREVAGALEGLGEARGAGGRPELDRARWEVRRRRATGRNTGRGGGVRRRSAATAATLVVVACAVAAVVPGSPLRSLFVEAGGDPEESGLVGGAVRTGASLPGMTGVAVGFRDSRVEVVLEGAEAGTQVELVVGLGDRVEVLAPEGARFRAGTGSVVVELGGHRPGSLPGAAGGADVVVRIPPGPGEVVLQSDRRLLSRWLGGAFQFGEGIEADPRSDGVRVGVPAADP